MREIKIILLAFFSLISVCANAFPWISPYALEGMFICFFILQEIRVVTTCFVQQQKRESMT